MTSMEKTVKLPSFDGKPESYQKWKMRFWAYAVVHKFRQALNDGGEPIMPTSEDAELDLTTEAGKKAEEAKKRNAVAIANFTMSFDTSALMGLIYKSMNADWPGGQAHLVVKALQENMNPRTPLQELR